MKKIDGYGWTEEQENQLRKLRAQNTMFYTEIAKKIGKPVQLVRWKAKKLGLKSTRETLTERFGKWNAKHNHLRPAVMKYFMTHTMEETRKRFGLTKSEVKSIFTIGYRMPELRHLRKDSHHDHSSWTVDQKKFLLQHAGLRSRDWVAAQIGRGNRTCIKERLQIMGLSSRTLQGITLSQFVKMFGKRPSFFIMTLAGPNGGPKTSMPTRWRIIPWVWLDREISEGRLKCQKEFARFVSARAMFQEWIFEGDPLKKMKRIVSEGYKPWKIRVRP